MSAVEIAWRTGVSAERGAIVSMSVTKRPRPRWWLGYLCVVVAAAATRGGAVNAATFNVNSTLDVPDVNPGDGVCETTPGSGLCTLRAAIQECNAPTPGGAADAINLPAGTYLLTRTGTGEQFALSGDLDVHGDLVIRGAGRETTRIDGGGIDRVFDVWTGSLTIRGVTIQHGTPEPGAFGGGVLLNGATLSLIKSRVTECTTTNSAGGGGIRSSAGNLTLILTAVSNNQANGWGGGLEIAGGTVTVRDSTITGNQCTGASALGAGMIIGSSAVATINSSTISGNLQPSGGDGSGGGGVYADALVSFSKVTIANNQGKQGGGLWVGGGTTTLSRCTVSHNAGLFGGGVLVFAAAATLEAINSTIAANTSTYGGGIDVYGTLHGNNLTIAHNEATDGPGLAARGGSTVTLANSILYGNTSPASDGPIDCSGTITSSGYLVIGNAGCTLTGTLTGNKIGVDPLLGPLQDNGSATLTYAIAAGSPAHDAGNPTAPGTTKSACEEIDQRGVGRPGSASNGSCDIGAFERSNCGNGVVQNPEVCDSGLGNGKVGVCCAAGCTTVACCGDGTVQSNIGEECDAGALNGAPGSCCASDCSFLPLGATCRGVSAGGCDVAETCSGTSASCPADQKQPNLTPCNDGNACTQVDACAGGVCTGGNPVACVAIDACHVAGTCDPTTGQCSNPNRANGSACSDGNACTQTDTCQSGSCIGGNPKVCVASDACHVAGTCSPATGACSNPASPNGTPCSDGDACTQTDACQSGACVGSTRTVCVPSDACHVAGTCDPASGVCTNPNASEGTSCNDGNPCNGSDSCSAGVCSQHSGNLAAGTNCTLGGVGGVCDGSGACLTGSNCGNGQVQPGEQCDDGLGANGTMASCCTTACQHKQAGVTCSDGNLCTIGDVCNAAGACQGGSTTVCSALDQCHTAGTCNPATGTCSNPPRINGTPCSDGNACTQSDSCQSGVCVAGTPLVCVAQDQCHAPGTCSPQTGQCSNPVATNGTPCSDGNACTAVDSCQAGSCIGGSPVVCGAQDQCHLAGVCNPNTGLCSQPQRPDGGGCDDGNACTQLDTCQGGACIGAAPKTCTAGQCQVPGTCNPATGQCSAATPGGNGTACSDNDACTLVDTCNNGTCVGGSPVVCTASDACHVPGTCNSATGACSNPNAPNGTTCNDGNACTKSDTCQGGVCVGASPVSCTVTDPCSAAGSCDPATGQCTGQQKQDGDTCSDGDACTRDDVCQGGVCRPGPPVQCPGLDDCHEPAQCEAGSCNAQPKPDGSTCNDGNLCTQHDECRSGRCVGGSPRDCPAIDQCHAPGICDALTGQCTTPLRPLPARCDDGDVCNGPDLCSDGDCSVHAPLAVGSDCIVGAHLGDCDGAGVCIPAVCGNGTTENGEECDGGECCDPDTCRYEGSGVQCGTETRQCYEQRECTGSSAQCPTAPRLRDGLCSDQDGCTVEDTCQSGECAPGPRVCQASLALRQGTNPKQKARQVRVVLECASDSGGQCDPRLVVVPGQGAARSIDGGRAKPGCELVVLPNVEQDVADRPQSKPLKCRSNDSGGLRCRRLFKFRLNAFGQRLLGCHDLGIRATTTVTRQERPLVTSSSLLKLLKRR